MMRAQTQITLAVFAAMFIVSSLAVFASPSSAAEGTPDSIANKLDRIAAGPPVVAELFTSQGCSSCPPADELMNRLAKLDNVIALSLPIDYWDRLGWPDTLADSSHTSRQKSYASFLGCHKYTPQLVVNGRTHVPGSKTQDVLDLLLKAQTEQNYSTPVTITREDGNLFIHLAANTTATGLTADVFAAPYYSADRIVDIERGENRGETVAYSHVVRGIKTIAHYTGAEQTIELPADDILTDGTDACAVLVQDTASGAIIGAAKLEPN